jgi:hypothetical protein
VTIVSVTGPINVFFSFCLTCEDLDSKLNVEVLIWALDQH